MKRKKETQKVETEIDIVDDLKVKDEVYQIRTRIYTTVLDQFARLLADYKCQIEEEQTANHIWYEQTYNKEIPEYVEDYFDLKTVIVDKMKEVAIELCDKYYNAATEIYKS